MKRLLLVSLIILALVLFTGCAASTNPALDVPDADGKLAGFWSGLWHGVISPVTFIISLFTDNVNIYDVHNGGNWYDFGFMFGISMVLGGGGSAAKRKK